MGRLNFLGFVFLNDYFVFLSTQIIHPIKFISYPYASPVAALRYTAANKPTYLFSWNLYSERSSKSVNKVKSEGSASVAL